MSDTDNGTVCRTNTLTINTDSYKSKVPTIVIRRRTGGIWKISSIQWTTVIVTQSEFQVDSDESIHPEVEFYSFHVLLLFGDGEMKKKVPRKPNKVL